jgi:uncharacterized protein
MMVERRYVEFEVEGGDRLRGCLFVPERSARHPAISMAHAYAGVKEPGLERFAHAFTEAGFVALVHDHRNFGSSDGAIRRDIDPWRQIAGSRRTISFLESLPAVDADRIGVWGTSFAGGHVLVLVATDRRIIRAVVAQVKTISGYQHGGRRMPPDAVAALEQLFDDDERAQFRGEPPRRQQLVCDDSSVQASYQSSDAISFYLQPLPQGAWMNEVTVRSGRLSGKYEPGAWIARVSPSLQMIVALTDPITLTDRQLSAYEQTPEPKKLVTIDGAISILSSLSRAPRQCLGSVNILGQNQ